ncbi:MAG: hypothetical protein C0508_19370 [Cyanobacteria bacterium PR.023]|jgi:hypothetical protein|nr:hypothetical protein [Cyanobacteria bacterium PR.023]
MKAMVTKETTDQVLWMADCYSLAKRFPNPHTWLSLLEPVETLDIEKLNPFHYWLWMEIWKAAQLAEKDNAEGEPAIAAAPKKAIAGPSAAKCPS